ncbi:hypothetical protein KCU83_g53, partial [Aureobasidium melanogenum]
MKPAGGSSSGFRFIALTYLQTSDRWPTSQHLRLVHRSSIWILYLALVLSWMKLALFATINRLSTSLMAKRQHNPDQRSLMTNTQLSSPLCYVPLQQRIENNALYTSGRSNQVGKRVQNYVWLSVDPFLPGVFLRLFSYLTRSHAVSNTCKEVYLSLIFAASYVFAAFMLLKLFCLDFDIAAMDVLPMNSRGS